LRALAPERSTRTSERLEERSRITLSEVSRQLWRDIDETAERLPPFLADQCVDLGFEDARVRVFD
jgi:hypothetical protein